ncbi:hypothetical protein F2Q68_00009104 [Brassica cretica]|uniref:Uncharacterized protein n=1 Tax=Brassica cretica TaxID=69181 RepID=A0A8S9KSM1_BRACR|nr:hypothetical protein F2Q68_00009104 [Brassica cretica]
MHLTLTRDYSEVFWSARGDPISSSEVSSLELRRESVDRRFNWNAIDTPFRLSIDTTTELSIDNPSRELYRAVGHKIYSAHILASLSTDTNSVMSIDSPSSSRQLPLARQTDHSSVKRA